MSIFIYFSSKSFSDSIRQESNFFKLAEGLNLVSGRDGAAASIKACGAFDPSANLGLDLFVYLGEF